VPSFDVGVDGAGYGLWPWDCVLEKMTRKMEWVKEHGKQFVDGENKADGQYDKNPNQRVIDTRMKNKEIFIKMGYPIDENMWPNSLPAQLPDCQQDTE
jgi:hypothetical protein